MELEELNCDHCGKFLCYVNSSDLNCSYFYCSKTCYTIGESCRLDRLAKFQKHISNSSY